MKKNYFFTLLFTLCVSLISYAQGTETFEKSNATATYADGNFVGENGITWTYVHSRDADGTASNVSSLTTKALLLRQSSSSSKVTSSAISGGIGDFSVKLYKGFTGNGDRQVELFINDVSKGTSVAFNDYDEHIFTVSGINITGDIVIEIRNIAGKQVIVDDITWTVPSTDPSLSITTPTDNQVFPSDVGNIPVNFSISNFTLAGDNGSEMTDGTGDGYILGSLTKNGVLDGTVNIFSTTGPEIENAVPGTTYLITAELVDNAGASLSPKVETTVTFSVEFPCDIDLGTFAKTCKIGVSNTYDISIPFTGGNTSTYTLTANNGTIGGDNPSTMETGTITISDVPEGTDVAFTLKGDVSNSICDISTNISSPICVVLPIVEPFDYTADTDLVANDLWFDLPTSSATKNNMQVKSNDDGAGNPILGSYYGATDLPAFSGNMMSMSGAGSDAYLGFEDKTSGTVYASFTFHVTDMTGFTKSAGGYFAILGDNNFRTKLWIKDPTAGDANEGLTFNLGLSGSGSTTYHTGFTANLAEPVFVVMSYNLDNDEVKLWTVPDATTFGTNTAPAANITLTGNGNAINRFTLRQDSTSETPFMDIDELRIGTSWKDVTSNPVASVKNNTIEGFATYPNPVTNNRFTVSSNSAELKQVSIFNVLGKRVFKSSISGTKSDVDVSSISSGLYILKVTEGNKIATSKLVIK